MVDNINFGGIHIGKCKGLTKKGKEVAIDIYQLTKDDKKLISRMNNKDIGKHQGLYLQALYDTHAQKKDVFVSVVNESPCGIASIYNSGSGTCEINRLVTWGNKRRAFSLFKHKFKNSGKALLDTMFKYIDKKSVTVLDVDAIPTARIFYEENGFALKSDDDLSSLSSQWPDKTFKKLSKEIDIKWINSKENVDLNDLKLKY